jgi:hypothetical protein
MMEWIFTKFSGEVMPLKMTLTLYFLIRSFYHSKMADVQVYEVDAKLAHISVGPWNFVCR